MHRGGTRIHRAIIIIHSGTARRRRRRIINPIHAALEKALGDSKYSQGNVEAKGESLEAIVLVPQLESQKKEFLDGYVPICILEV